MKMAPGEGEFKNLTWGRAPRSRDFDLGPI